MTFIIVQVSERTTIIQVYDNLVSLVILILISSTRRMLIVKLRIYIKIIYINIEFNNIYDERIIVVFITASTLFGANFDTFVISRCVYTGRCLMMDV